MQEMSPVDAGFAERVRDSFARQPFMRTLGVELACIQAGYCELKVPFRAELTQQHGYFHAGVVGTIADNSSGYAAYSLMAPDSAPLTAEFKINLLAPGTGDFLLGKGRVIKNGRSLKICQSEVFAVKDGEETLCAIALVTLMELHGTSDYKK